MSADDSDGSSPQETRRSNSILDNIFNGGDDDEQAAQNVARRSGRKVDSSNFSAKQRKRRDLMTRQQNNPSKSNDEFDASSSDGEDEEFTLDNERERKKNHNSSVARREPKKAAKHSNVGGSRKQGANARVGSTAGSAATLETGRKGTTQRKSSVAVAAGAARGDSRKHSNVGGSRTQGANTQAMKKRTQQSGNQSNNRPAAASAASVQGNISPLKTDKSSKKRKADEHHQKKSKKKKKKKKETAPTAREDAFAPACSEQPDPARGKSSRDGQADQTSLSSCKPHANADESETIEKNSGGSDNYEMGDGGNKDRAREKDAAVPGDTEAMQEETGGSDNHEIDGKGGGDEAQTEKAEDKESEEMPAMDEGSVYHEMGEETKEDEDVENRDMAGNDSGDDDDEEEEEVKREKKGRKVRGRKVGDTRAATIFGWCKHPSNKEKEYAPYVFVGAEIYASLYQTSAYKEIKRGPKRAPYLINNVINHWSSELIDALTAYGEKDEGLAFIRNFREANRTKLKGKDKSVFKLIYPECHDLVEHETKHSSSNEPEESGVLSDEDESEEGTDATTVLLERMCQEKDLFDIYAAVYQEGLVNYEKIDEMAAKSEVPFYAIKKLVDGKDEEESEELDEIQDDLNAVKRGLYEEDWKRLKDLSVARKKLKKKEGTTWNPENNRDKQEMREAYNESLGMAWSMFCNIVSLAAYEGIICNSASFNDVVDHYKKLIYVDPDSMNFVDNFESYFKTLQKNKEDPYEMFELKQDCGPQNVKQALRNLERKRINICIEGTRVTDAKKKEMRQLIHSAHKFLMSKEQKRRNPGQPQSYLEEFCTTTSPARKTKKPKQIRKPESSVTLTDSCTPSLQSKPATFITECNAPSGLEENIFDPYKILQEEQSDFRQQFWELSPSGTSPDFVFDPNIVKVRQHGTTAPVYNLLQPNVLCKSWSLEEHPKLVWMAQAGNGQSQPLEIPLFMNLNFQAVSDRHKWIICLANIHKQQQASEPPKMIFRGKAAPSNNDQRGMHAFLGKYRVSIEEILQLGSRGGYKRMADAIEDWFGSIRANLTILKDLDQYTDLKLYVGQYSWLQVVHNDKVVELQSCRIFKPGEIIGVWMGNLSQQRPKYFPFSLTDKSGTTVYVDAFSSESTMLLEFAVQLSKRFDNWLSTANAKLLRNGLMVAVREMNPGTFIRYISENPQSEETLGNIQMSTET